MSGIRETLVRFGDGEYLVGVVSEPTPPAARQRPAFIFLNAGLLHRIGPSRTYVMLARRLAGLGFTGLRFDHGGIGDSCNRRDTLSAEEGEASEVVRAMDFLIGTRGLSSFVLVGLCSGARMALKVGGMDERVTGVVSLDGQTFRTWRFWWHRFRSRRRSVISYLLLRGRGLPRSPG